MESLGAVTRSVTSKGAQRMVVNLTLLAAGAISLLCLATIATGLFWHSYLPDQVITAPLYLQYGAGPHPFAITPLTDMSLKSQQPYDITISLTMPRSPANTERGNFMVDLQLLKTRPALGNITEGPSAVPKESDILFRSRRPAIVPYEDPVVNLASRVIFLAYHLMVQDTHVLRLDVKMAEKVVLSSQQSALPKWMSVEVLAGQTIETYNASLIMNAQLRGLRWLMFHYRLPIFVIAAAIFWAAEVLFMLAAWLAWTRPGPSKTPEVDKETELERSTQAIKKEEDDLSDIPMTFPTYGKQPPLAYEPTPRAASPDRGPEGGLPHDAEADDEAEDDGQSSAPADSGIGTSYSEASRGGDIRKRPSRAGLS